MTTFDVFISYSHSDKAIADKVCAALEASDIRCWIAPRNIVPGMTWSAAIVDAIAHSRAMVLIFSAAANASQQIQREVDGAVSKNIHVVPMRIESVEPTGSLAYFLKAVQWLDAFPQPIEQHLQSLADSVNVLLGKTAQPASPDILSLGSGAAGCPSALDSAAADVGSASATVASHADQASFASRTVSKESVATGKHQRGQPDKPILTRASTLIGLLVVLCVAVVAMVVSRRTPTPIPKPVETSAEVPVQKPFEVQTEWASLPLGTRISNRTAAPISTFTQPDRSSERSIDISPMQTIPPSGTNQLLARKEIRRESWIRFPVGSKEGYIPEADVTVISPP